MIAVQAARSMVPCVEGVCRSAQCRFVIGLSECDTGIECSSETAAFQPCQRVVMRSL